MSNELKANIADAQKFFDKTKCTSVAEVMVQYANSRPTEAKTLTLEAYKECFEKFIPTDKWDEATAFLSTYGSGLAKDMLRRNL